MPLSRIAAFLVGMVAFSKLDAQYAESPWAVGFDAYDSTFSYDKKQIEGVSEISRTPLFDNAPFLRLRSGDKLVFGKVPDKGEPRTGYFLLSGGKYYEIVARKIDDKLLLEDDWNLRVPLLFEWEFTLPSAQVLAQWDKASGERLNLIQYVDIYRAMVKRFPDKECRRPDTIKLAEDRVTSIPGQHVAEFQGIAYDATFNRLERYILRIGPATCAMYFQVLIQGAPRVDRYEFDGDYIRSNNANPGLNGTFFPMPDPATAKQKRAEYEEWLAFQTIVLDVIEPNRVRSDDEKVLASPLPGDSGKIPAATLELAPPAHP